MANSKFLSILCPPRETVYEFAIRRHERLADDAKSARNVSMIKAIAVVLVSMLAAPSGALGQAPTVEAHKAAIVQVAFSGQSSGGLRQSIAREAAKLTEHVTTSLQPQPPPRRTWAGRHPVALGAMIGAAGGVTWGAVVCSNACEGGLHTPYWMALAAGVGAGIGAGIGAVVSRIRP